MKEREIRIGDVYGARVSGKLTTVRVTYKFHQCNYKGRASTKFRAINLTTNRPIIVTAARLRPITKAKDAGYTDNMLRAIRRAHWENGRYAL